MGGCLFERLGKKAVKGSVALLSACMLLSACGCGGSGTTTAAVTPLNAGPYAVLNGASLASATSHWVAKQCGLEAELTNDAEFYSVVTDTAGITYSTDGQLAIGPNTNSVTVNSQYGISIVSLGNISGSTTSGAFTAIVKVSVNQNVQTLGTCGFVLVQKGIPLPAERDGDAGSESR